MQLARLGILLGWVADDAEGWLVGDDVDAGDAVDAASFEGKDA